MKRGIFQAVIVLFWSCSITAFATDYNVGPGKDYSNIGDVPWESLNPGDAVRIHWRSTSYKEKWVIGRSGTAQNPILVTGVANTNGDLPIIDGNGATTRQALSFWNERRGIIKIGGSSTPSEAIPQHITIENLEIRSARPPYNFTDHSGGTQTYAENAASFYVEIGRHLTLRNCIIRDSGNGIFIGANGGDTQDILLEKNHIYDNGIVDSIYHHNTYTAALRLTYQYNRMGNLRAGALGNNLKDRSAGLVIRYNWIENGNRQLDLVDAEDTDALVNNPLYRKTYVYGNILKEADGEGNSQMIHYGGDSGNKSIYRKGTLYLYNNTLISTRSGNTTMLRLSSNGESADVFNNIVYQTASGSRLALLSREGQLTIRNNWFKTGWRVSHDSFSGTLIDDDSSIEGSEPGFNNFAQSDYHLSNSAQALDVGIALHPDLLATHPLIKQYKSHQQSENRINDGQLDLGAFETEQFLRGDVNGDDTIDLTDVMLSLRVLGGHPDALSMNPKADIGGNRRVAFEEAIYGLQDTAGLIAH